MSGHLKPLKNNFFAELSAYQFPSFCRKTPNACRTVASVEKPLVFVQLSNSNKGIKQPHMIVKNKIDVICLQPPVR